MIRTHSFLKMACRRCFVLIIPLSTVKGYGWCQFLCFTVHPAFDVRMYDVALNRTRSVVTFLFTISDFPIIQQELLCIGIRESSKVLCLSRSSIVARRLLATW